MIAVIKGDIINSRFLKNPKKWIDPIKELLIKYGSTPRNWEIVWGDFFQLELQEPAEAIKVALEIKAIIKSIKPEIKEKTIKNIDVRLAIGIGEKSYSANRISESNGDAFIFSGEKFEMLKKEKTTLAIKTQYIEFDEDINLNLKLANTFIEKWSINSAEVIKLIINKPNIKQEELGTILGIKQNSVSGRWSRANADLIIELDNLYRKKVKQFFK